MVGKAKTLVLEIMGHTARPDRMVLVELRWFLAKEVLGANIQDSSDPDQDALKVLGDRVAFVAVKEDQGLGNLELAPEVFEQVELSICLVDPAPLSFRVRGSPQVEVLGLADGLEILLPEPSVGRGTDRIGRELLGDRRQLAIVDGIMMGDGVSTRRKRHRVTAAGRLPTGQVGEVLT